MTIGLTLNSCSYDSYRGALLLLFMNKVGSGSSSFITISTLFATIHVLAVFHHFVKFVGGSQDTARARRFKASQLVETYDNEHD